MATPIADSSQPLITRFFVNTAKEKMDVFKELEKLIKENYGKRCKDKYWACYTCIVWNAFDTLKEAIYE